MRARTTIRIVVFAIAALLATAFLAGCHTFTVADVQTTPATVRLDGLQAFRADIAEDLTVAETEGEGAGVIATFKRGDVVEFITLAADGRAAIRIGEGEEAVCALVDRHLLLLQEDKPFSPYTAFAMLGTTVFSDFSLKTGEEWLAVETPLEIVDEIDGVLLAGPEGSIRYLRPWAVVRQAPVITSKVDGAEVYADVLARDDEITIIGEHGDCYLLSYPGDAEGAEFPALIAKWLVRTPEEAAFEGRSGYAVYNCVVYDSALMTNAIAEPSVDTVIEVIDEFGGVAFVRLPDGTEGYLPSGNVTATTNYVAPRRYYGGGGGGGSSSSSGSQDGGDISLTAFMSGVAAGPADFETGAATTARAAYVAGSDEGLPAVWDEGRPGAMTGIVLSAGTPVFWALLDRGDEVHAAPAEDGATFTVSLAGRTGWMISGLARRAGESAAAPLDLFTQEGAGIYADHARTVKLRTCGRNDVVRVVDEYGDGYVIEFATKDGTVFAYITKSVTSATQIPAPATRPRSGGGGGGSSSGSSGSSGGNSSEWTNPVL
ncbi:MAG: hypothetical protein IKD70_00455 [Eggerthellaceae bacterium]|nr:hypothetical protein [Eggerthellaceae bacterium]